MVFSFITGGRKKLHQDVQSSIKASFADGTRKNFKTQWFSFFLFCTFFGFNPLPSYEPVLCAYCQFLSRSFKAVASIRNYLHGIKVLHLFLGLEVKSFDSFKLKLLLRGLARLKPHCPKKALPITPDLLVEFLPFLDLSTPGDATYWCLFLLAFVLMSRKSNMVPTSGTAFDKNKQLCRGDVLHAGHCLLVLFKWSKTNQFGQRIIQIPVLSIPGSVLCPVAAFKRMLQLTPAQPSSPLFLIPHANYQRVVTYRNLQSKLRELVSLTGRNPSLYTSHSFRRGGATWAFRAQVPGELIKLHGDWHSDAYLEYLDFSLEDKMTVASSMIHLITKRFG